MGAPREDAFRTKGGCLRYDVEEHIAFCIAAMRAAADALGLRGNHAASAT
jgi:hypothetical protein